MKKRLFKSVSWMNIISLIALLLLPALYLTSKAEASNLTTAMMRIDNMTAGGATTGTVCARATSNPTGVEHVAIQFPANWTVSATTSNWTVDTTNIGWPAGASAWPGIGTATAANSGTRIVVFPSTSLVNTTTTYCFNWLLTAAVSSYGTPTNSQIGYIETQDSGSATIDRSQVALATVGNDTLTITGTVNPTFTFSLSQTSTSFALISNSVSDASPTSVVSIVTNARNGYTTWVKDANNGTLNSAGTSSNIPTPGVVGGASYNLASMTANGAFGLGVTVSAGVTVNAAYDGTTAGYAGTLSNAFRPIASSTTYSSSDTITLIPRAIAKTTQAPASDYTDTLTIVAAGQF